MLLRVWVCLCSVVWMMVCAVDLRAQDDGQPLIDMVPFDVIVLTQAAGGKSVKIAPLPLRNYEKRPAETEKLEVVLLSHPERKYEILWRDIDKLNLFERMIYDEAMKKLSEKDFIAAFMNLSFLMQNYPKTPNLEKLRRDFLFQSAAVMFAESRADFSRYFQTMSTLEELHSTAPDYENNTVMAGLSKVTDTLMKHYESKGDMASAKQLLSRLEKAYGEKLQSVVDWKAKLLNMAEQRKAEAIAMMNQGKFREARSAAMDMSNISPDIEGGPELVAEIRRRHPMIRVGVTQRAGDLDPGSLVNWSARRAGALVYRPVVKFMDTGTEGGKYQFALGKMKLSEDNLQLMMTIDPKIPAGISGYDLAQVLTKRATPTDASYDASWAAVVRSVSTPNPTQLLIRLQRPHVLPQALLQFSFPDLSDAASPLAGLYRLNATDKLETSFVVRDKQASGGAPVEIVEVFYEDAKVAANDLLRGEIDAVDQVYPTDARRYEQSKLAKVGSYLLPSVHMLVPVSEHPYMIKDKFRRALMYATNRHEILRGELIGSDNPEDGRVLSGPFPMGTDANDPLNYAYDANIKPKPYEPRLAKLLLYMVEKEVASQYQKLNQPVPPNTPLRIGVPNYELARVAAQALLEQWKLVGVKAEIVPLPEGKAFDAESKCDLVYMSTTMWEPAIDIERLLGGSSPAKSNNAFIVQALAKIRKARSWRETRVALQDLHRLVDYHLPILPLWQITDRFAYSLQLQGLSNRSVSLYDKVSDWRLTSPGVTVASSGP